MEILTAVRRQIRISGNTAISYGLVYTETREIQTIGSQAY